MSVHYRYGTREDEEANTGDTVPCLRLKAILELLQGDTQDRASRRTQCCAQPSKRPFFPCEEQLPPWELGGFVCSEGVLSFASSLAATYRAEVRLYADRFRLRASDQTEVVLALH